MPVVVLTIVTVGLSSAPFPPVVLWKQGWADQTPHSSTLSQNSGTRSPDTPSPGAVLQQLPTWAFQTPPELELLSPQGGLGNPLAQRLVQPPGQCLTFPCASSVRPTGLEGPRGHRGPCVAKCGGAYVGTGNGLLANIPEKGGEGTGGWTPLLEAHVGHCGPGVGAEMRARPLPQLPARLLSSSVLSSSLSISTCLSTFEIVQRTKL